MHGNSNIKFIVAKQAKEIYKYKTTKRKVYRTNSAIWFNKQTPVAAVTVYSAPEDGRKGRPKHVEHTCSFQ